MIGNRDAQIGTAVAAVVCVCVVAAAGPASAATFFIYGSGGNTFGWPEGCTFQESGDAPQDDARSCSHIYGSWVSGFAMAERGLVHASAHSDWPAACGCSLGAEHHEYASVLVDDLVFTGPPGATSVMVQARLDVTAAEYAYVGGCCGLAGTSTRVVANLYPVGNVDVGPHVESGRYTVAIGQVALGVAYQMWWNVTADAGAGHYDPAEADAQIVAHLPIGEPVFILPEGYTANSAELNIVDNLWLGPVNCAQVMQEPQAQAVVEGEEATFSVSAAGTTPAYQWRRDGEEIVDGPEGASAGGGTVSGSNTATLVIADVQASDAGTYDCVVTNACNATTSAGAELSVQAVCVFTCGDLDGSGDVNLVDFTSFSSCMGEVSPFSPLCTCADLDGSGQVDLNDFVAFATVFGVGSGNVPPNCQ